MLYFPSGIIKEQGNFKNGEKIGKWLTYDSLGVQINSIKYKK